MTKEDLSSCSGTCQKEKAEAQQREEDELINKNPVSQTENQEKLMIEGGREREREILCSMRLVLKVSLPRWIFPVEAGTLYCHS